MTPHIVRRALLTLGTGIGGLTIAVLTGTAASAEETAPNSLNELTSVVTQTTTDLTGDLTSTTDHVVSTLPIVSEVVPDNTVNTVVQPLVTEVVTPVVNNVTSAPVITAVENATQLDKVVQPVTEHVVKPVTQEVVHTVDTTTDTVVDVVDTTTDVVDEVLAPLPLPEVTAPEVTVPVETPVTPPAQPTLPPVQDSPVEAPLAVEQTPSTIEGAATPEVDTAVLEVSPALDLSVNEIIFPTASSTRVVEEPATSNFAGLTSMDAHTVVTASVDDSRSVFPSSPTPFYASVGASSASSGVSGGSSPSVGSQGVFWDLYGWTVDSGLHVGVTTVNWSLPSAPGHQPGISPD